jgi:aryl-alcohol dehydrogenase-like predicted oxidoreductase
VNRREFIQALGGAALVSAFPQRLFAQQATTTPLAQTSPRPATSARAATDRILLGPRQIPVTRLAMGTGSNGWGKNSNQTRKLGIQGLANHLQAAHADGVTFWDAADQYGTHPHLGLALKSIPRDKVTILTKSTSSTYKDIKADIDRFRKELGTEYLDILLLHCLTDADWNVKRRGAMDAISEAQAKGIVRSHGCSCHTLGALKTAAAEPWVEIDLARINPDGAQMDAPPETVLGVLRQMKAAGKGVIGMKIFGGGKLVTQQDRALKYALSLDCVDCFTIGTESREQFLDILKRIPANSAIA